MLADLLEMIDQGIISGKIAKTVFEEMFISSKSAEQIVRERGLTQISDKEKLEEIIDHVLAENPQVVDDVRQGKGKALGFLVGQVMKASAGKANPAVVHEILKRKL